MAAAWSRVPSAARRVAVATLLPHIDYMPANITSKNQLTLPKRVVQALDFPTHLDVEVKDGRLILTLPGVGAADAVRLKLEALGITKADVADARQPG